MKISLEHVLFTSECRATLDGSHEWKSAAIIGNVLVGPFEVADGVKMSAEDYIDFLKEHLVSWKKIAFRKSMVFVHDNAPSHAARLATEYLNNVQPVLLI